MAQDGSLEAADSGCCEFWRALQQRPPSLAIASTTRARVPLLSYRCWARHNMRQRPLHRSPRARFALVGWMCRWQLQWWLCKHGGDQVLQGHQINPWQGLLLLRSASPSMGAHPCLKRRSFQCSCSLHALTWQVPRHCLQAVHETLMQRTALPAEQPSLSQSKCPGTHLLLRSHKPQVEILNIWRSRGSSHSAAAVQCSPHSSSSWPVDCTLTHAGCICWMKWLQQAPGEHASRT